MTERFHAIFYSVSGSKWLWHYDGKAFISCLDSVGKCILMYWFIQQLLID
jgi:hypothetical protein